MPATLRFDGAKFRHARTTRGLTQADLARAAHVSTDTVARIEAEKTDPRAGTITRIARVLDVSVDELITIIEDVGSVTR
jgi:transcriptional regulator with XRE-family HTH domain